MALCFLFYSLHSSINNWGGEVETELEPLGCSGCSGICLLRNTVDDSSWGAAGSFLVLKGSSALTVRPIHWAYTLIAMRLRI
jgi:hypothetical protein